MGMSPKQRMEMDKKWRQYRLENVLTEEENLIYFDDYPF